MGCQHHLTIVLYGKLYILKPYTQLHEHVHDIKLHEHIYNKICLDIYVT